MPQSDDTQTLGKEGPAYWYHYVFQVTGAALCAYGFLFLFKGTDHIDLLWALGFSSLVSTTYILFTSPCSPVIISRVILGGYFVNMAIGAVTHLTLSKLLPTYQQWNQDTMLAFSLALACALFVNLVVTVYLKVKHPPAVAVFIVFVLDLHRYYIFAIIAISAVILALIQHFLGRYMRDL